MDGPGGVGGPAAVPAPLRRGGALVALEGVALVALGLGYALSGVLGEPEDRLATVLEGGAALVVGLALVAVGRALGSGLGWAWSPTILAQAFIVIVAVGLLQGGVLAVGLPLVAVAGAVLYQLATPESRDAYRGRG